VTFAYLIPAIVVTVNLLSRPPRKLEFSEQWR
jgi:hypothetical protein